MNNLNISLTIIDENGNTVYISNNAANNKATIVKLKDYRYATIKPIKNKYIRLKEILQSFSHKEICDMIMQKIIVNNIGHNK